MEKILVVDDEARLRKLIKDFLSVKGYQVIEAADGEEAIKNCVADGEISLMILDVMMPKKDGYEVMEELRQFSKMPVIMLTAKGEEKDELKGFDLGVDEYVTKPFSPKILMARVEAILRRSHQTNITDEKTETQDVGGILVNRVAHTVSIEGKEIDLSYKEFQLLIYFIDNQGIALSRENILSGVWDYDYYGDARTIDTHVKKLRSKLEDKGDYIKTIWGVGYKFTVC